MGHLQIPSSDIHRRRSVDVGGLALAFSIESSGQGWGGWDEQDVGETRYAELLGSMYNHTQSAVNGSTDHRQVHSILPRAEAAVEIPNNMLMSALNRIEHLPSVESLEQLAKSLTSWQFEPHKLTDDLVVGSAIILFQTLFRIEGLQKQEGVTIEQISAFIHHLRSVYRGQNSYHNFQHALDVLQATYMFLYSAGRVPPVSILLLPGHAMWTPPPGTDSPFLNGLTNQDLFVLFIAAIGHDVGHPGFTNNFMKNAKAPLSAVYDDQSALEQMHYALLTQIMRANGLGAILDRPAGSNKRKARKLLSDVVLATDMSVHFKFMNDFADMVAERPEHTEENTRITLICQALIKCADISNPSRPQVVSQHWAQALAEEWTCQETLEKHLHLPSTVYPAKDDLSTAKSQIFFISTFAKPLLELVCKAIPQMEPFATQCRDNLTMWSARNETLLSATYKADTMSKPPTPLRTSTEALNEWCLPSIDASTKMPSLFQKPVAVQITTTTSTGSTSSSSTPPISPTGSAGSSSFISPRSEAFSLPPPPSAKSHHPVDVASAVRAAYQAGVRKKKTLHRTSWDCEAKFDASYRSGTLTR